MGDKYVVAAPLVYLKVRDAHGALISSTFYAGAPVPEDVDEDSLQHHLDSGLVIKQGDPAADVLAVPAGTPVPGEPPNVPVTEQTGAPQSLDDKVEAARKTASAKPAAKKSE